MKRSWRPLRFVPLVEVGPQPRAGGPFTRLPGASSTTEGFQAGMDRGYHDGRESGERAGYEEGLERGIREGRIQGVEQGQRQAREETARKFAELAAPVEAVHERLLELQADYEAALRKEVVELVGRVARQVVRCELTLQPAQLMSLVDEALGTLPSRPEGPLEVYLNPEDMGRIQQIDPTRAGRWNLIPDRTLEMGECRIKAGEREVDAGCRGRLAASMNQVAEQILAEGEASAAAAAADDGAVGAAA